MQCAIPSMSMGAADIFKFCVMVMIDKDEEVHHNDDSDGHVDGGHEDEQ